MGVFAVACYKPRAGKESMLLDAVRDHMPILRAEGLIEDRPAYVMKAEDGTIVEISGNRMTQSRARIRIRR